VQTNPKDSPNNGSGSMFSTIRGRIITVFAIFLSFVCVLTAFYWWSVQSIRARMLITERIEDLLNNILEARRYEKNFFFYRDLESLAENIAYTESVVKITDELSQDIVRVSGKTSFDRFRHSLEEYKAAMEGYRSRGGGGNVVPEAEKIRADGKSIVDFALDLLKRKRERIHNALTSTLILPFAFMGIFVLLIVLVVQLLSQKMLRPLGLIRKTIGRVAEGDFSPIPYEETSKDEISQLIVAFNRMSSELEAKQEQLVQSRKIAAIGTFTAGIAHELNNPINNIYLTAETLLEDYESFSPPEGKELVLDVLNQAEKAGEIVKNLLDFSRSDTPSFVNVNIRECIEKTLKLVKNQVMLAGIRTSVNIRDGIPDLEGNPRNLEQVFLNLLLNAIQAMPGGGKINIDVRLDTKDHVRIDVKDTGKGIKPEQLERIFEPFFTTKGVGRGTGLGLAVTYALVKKHRGYIEVQSEVDVGTTFSIYLPIQQKK
jgi:two-component system NtrC family sensor kinase